MEKKVGIPRALFYYKYYPFWKAFLNEFSVEIIVSDKTTKKILDDGIKSCVDEACLAVKLFYGHVLNLKDRVDYLLIPRFTSVSKGEFICPKFGGLPDMIRNSIPGIPEIIDVEVNLHSNKKNSLLAALEVGTIFCKDKKRIKKAYKKALHEHRNFRTVQKSGYPNMEDYLSLRKLPLEKIDANIKVAIIGHVYNVYDSYINMDLINKLSSMNVQVETAEMYESKQLYSNTGILPKRFFWNFGSTAMGYALELISRNNIDGIIYLMTFGCGIDSFVCDLVERRIRRKTSIPFIVLTLDEHSGEAGVNTRIEAFIDMIRFKKQKQGIPKVGKLLENRAW